jgi:hypothetical protein
MDHAVARAYKFVAGFLVCKAMARDLLLIEIKVGQEWDFLTCCIIGWRFHVTGT